MWVTLFIVAVTAAIGFALGALLFERFVEEQPRGRRAAARLRSMRHMRI